MYESQPENDTLKIDARNIDFERAFMSDVTRDDRAGAPRGYTCGCVVFALGETRCEVHGVWS